MTETSEAKTVRTVCRETAKSGVCLFRRQVCGASSQEGENIGSQGHALFLGLLIDNVRYRDGRYDLATC